VIRRLVADVTPLRISPAFRRLWLGQTLSMVGSRMTVFAVALQVYRLTSSSAAVGAVGLVSGASGITVGLLAGGFLDAVDRRRVLLATSVAQLATSAGLAAQAFAGNDSLWPIYVLVGVQAALGAVGAPARSTYLPRLLPADRLTAGAALLTLVGRLGGVVGPSLAGVLTATAGLKFCYLVDAVSFLAALYGVVGLPSLRVPQGEGGRPGLRAMAEGLRFIRRSPVLTGVLLADVSATVLAVPVALFPAIAAERFGGDPALLGLMTTAMAVGGVLGTTLSGPVSRVQRQGRAMLVAASVWGLSIAAFGVVHGLALTLLALLVADAADVSSVVLRATVVQTATPEAFRGRVSATDYVVGAGVPQLGNFRAGLVATATTPGFSALSGGLAATAAAGVLALCFPALVRYRAFAPAGAQVPAADQTGASTVSSR
jgi:MFS family permease